MKKSSVVTKFFVALISIVFIAVLGGGAYLAYTQQKPTPKYFDETMTFAIDAETSTLINIPAWLFTNKENSRLVLTDDGKITLTFMIEDSLVATANNYTDIVAGIDLNLGVEQYCEPLFPGFTLNDVPYSFGLLEHTLGLSFIGLDIADPRYEALREELKKTGTLPKNIALPEHLGIKYEGRYEIKTIPSEKGERTAIYFGKELTDDEDRYFMMELTENKGKKHLNFRIEFLQLTLNAYEA